MINYFEALSIIFDNINKYVYKKSEYDVELLSSVNKISCMSVICGDNIPSFNNSAMDGYAVRYEDLLLSSKCGNRKFKLLLRVEAGKFVKLCSKKFAVIEIMTGARVPSGFDSVVKIEDTKKDRCDNVFFKKNVIRGENIRKIGEDYKTYDVLVEQGEVITISHVMALSVFGKKEISVFDKVVIYLICTGNEICEKNSLNVDKDACFVNNVNGPFVRLFFKFLGFDVVYLGLVKDCIKEFSGLINSIIYKTELALIITTGAVSKGTCDFLPTYLTKMGATFLFHGVDIKPGKPILFAKLYSNNYFFCLPGNIISSVIGVRFFIYPFIRYLYGLLYEYPVKAELFNKFVYRKKLDVFLKAFMFLKKNKLYVNILKEQESFKISGLVEANCFVFLRKSGTFNKGDILDIYMLEPFCWKNLL